MSVEQKRELSYNFENDSVSLGAGESVDIYFTNGTDTTSARYLNLGNDGSFGFELLPTVACSITKINGKALKAAISVGTGGIRMVTGRYTSITVQAGSATIFEVLGKN